MPVLADFAKLPPQRKVLVFVVAGALLGGLYYQFLLKPLTADLASADGDHIGKIQQNQKLEHDKEDFKALKLHNCQTQRIIEENQTALPTEAEMPAFFETLNRKVLESGVEVHRWQEESEQSIETFVKVPVTLEISGSFMQIKKFFASLVEKKKKPSIVSAPLASDTGGCSTAAVEEHDRIVSIENLKLTNPTVINHEIVLTAQFTATTYRKEDETAAAPGTVVKKPAPAPAPAPTPGTGSGSALPPADTPAGAKARAEGAMDKDEQRTRSVAPNGAAAAPKGAK